MPIIIKSNKQRKQSIIYRYSDAFKLNVISEIESGQLTAGLAQRKYQISGNSTIHNWIKKFGKNNLITKVVRVESPQERDKMKALEEQVKSHQAALADSQVKLFAMESLVAVSEEYTGLDLKKTLVTSCRPRRKKA